ncbi:MAG TPA: glucose-6-phosphate dehydrogenase [Candidatus Dependentiae bacterium]|nr:glucose-6-phosphate dehydrogenase [Candidatus Dependentiae bacterium]
MNSCTIIIFGATGDLSKRKLIPAIYKLVADKKLDNFIIVGSAIEDITAEQMLSQAKEFIPSLNEQIWDIVRNRTYYQQLDIFNQEGFAVLSALVTRLEKKYGLGNRLLYLAVAAHFFCPITHHLARSGLAQRLTEQKQRWNRIVYEKPFGHNLQSAREINKCIAKLFNESQIYRIDHFLTKEVVSNIALVRFTNCVFEPLWNNQFIDHIQIILSEKIGIQERGGYYDRYGALCDVVQNHMLELLALIGMEAPEKLTGEYVRSERVKVLEKIRFVDGVLGQYTSYTKEKDVKPNSKTETFAALYLTVDNLRWAGVPFYLKTGKCLDKKETVIHIKFKQVDCLLIRNCPTESNWLTMKISPDATFSLHLNVKKPGSSDELVPVSMEFCHSCLFGPYTPQAYEVVFEEIIRGEQATSVRFDEIEYAWRVIDYIKEKQLAISPYACGSNGPKESELFAKKHGIRWRS